MIEIIDAQNKDFYKYYKQLFLLESFNSRFRDEEFIEYHRDYFKNKKFLDKSFCVLENKKPVIILSCFTVNSKVPKDNPAYILLNPKQNKEVQNKFFEYFNNLFLKSIKGKFYFRDFHSSENNNFFIDFLIRKKEVIPKLIFIGYINLEENENSIWSYLRSSYKNLIKKYQSKLKVIILEKKNIKLKENLFIKCRDEYKKNILKKNTRSNKNWLSFKKLIQGGKAMILTCFDDKNKLIGYISITSFANYSYYASALNIDKSLPVNHLLLWESIKKSKKDGKKKLELGICKTDRVVNNKLTNIFMFKKGFCSNFRPVIDYEF